MKRRSFLKTAAGAAAFAGLGELGFLAQLRPVSAAEAKLKPEAVRLHPEIEPLVRLLENTSRERVLEEVAARIQRGTTYREVLAALLLAGVRNIQPRPVGFKFHAVLVVNSAHLASLSSPDTDRWLPIFWAIDQFKSSQAADVKEGDWTMGPVDESAVPPAHKARQALIDAMDDWDEAAGDAAIVGLARSAGAHEIFEILCRYGARDFREIGHKEIYVANSFRTLEAIGWQHAEPVLRSLVYALLDRDRDRAKGNPAKLDLDADRPFRHNLETAKKIRADWLGGKPDPDATTEMLAVLRAGSPKEASDKALELLNRGTGTAPQSLFDAFFDGAGELLMRAPGILSLHATTFTNAVHYSWQHCGDDQTRRLLLLQNAAFLPLFRGNNPDKGERIDSLEPLAPKANGAGAIEEIFADISGKDQGRLTAARKIVAWLKDNPDPRPFADASRRLIFTKGNNAHDYKYSSAVLEDYHAMSPPWRDRYLAASAFYLRGSGDKDNDLVRRTRAALSA
ncbi:MAG TPA: hypothetical protein VFT34_12315 [Verrucomicrobiae bacterium]|nr:hypothetical protein [Verrucomicrobiae bacterium]